MECHYHPEREGTDICAICGKSICKECGLEIAGKIYCKECLESIVGLSLDNRAEQSAEPAQPAEPVRTEPARLNKQPAEESIYNPQAESQPAEPVVQPSHEIKQISEDSPYNIKDNVAIEGEPESSYLHESEVPIEPAPQAAPEPQITQTTAGDDFIYPDHSYEPEPTSARAELEDKYEKYLDDLYFDEQEDVPLDQQLAKDEEQYGSLTRKPYSPKEEPPLKQEPTRPMKAPENETPEEMEARIRAEILAEQKGEKLSDTNIHNINYKDEKEPMGAVDVLLTILLIIVILIVIYYLLYIFILHASYPTFMDAVYGLSNPQNVINNILTPQ
jgi:hypothetical protein